VPVEYPDKIKNFLKKTPTDSNVQWKYEFPQLLKTPMWEEKE
jgi:hypothetical protein